MAVTKAELDYILGTMLDSHKDVSDLNFTVEKPMQVEAYGELGPVAFEPPIERLTPFQSEMIALEILNRNRRLTDDLIITGSCDCSYSLGHKARFRVNIFTQRGHYTIILRKLTTDIPTLAQLNMPPVFHKMTKEKTGLILVTGATGSEMDGDDRKKSVGRLKDDPRQLGKGWARLVGSAPLSPDRKVRRRRQDSPVPLVAVARGQLCEKELGGEGR
jgi:hypothetical protein